MDRKETAQIIAFLREIFPNGKEVTKSTVNAWYELLKDYPYADMWMIAKEVVKEYDGYTMPPPGLLIKKYDELANPSVVEYWNLAEKAIRKGRSFTIDDFHELPKPLQQYFGGVSAIHDLGMADISNLAFEKNRFIKQFPIIRKRAEMTDRLALEDKAKELSLRLGVSK